MADNLIRVLDVETSGLGESAQPCEVATVDLVNDEGTWRRGAVWSTLCNPGHPIEPGASGIHHITDADVAGAPLWNEIKGRLTMDTTASVYAAHNSVFERRFFDPPVARWICTYRVGIMLWPACPDFKNQTLRYWLGLKLDPALAMPAHRAAPDAYVTAALLRKALTDFEVTVEDMVKISAGPVVLPRFHFGKHAGLPLADVPDGYLEWVAKQADMDPDARYTAKWHLHNRRAAAGNRGPVDPGRVAADQQAAQAAHESTPGSAPTTQEPPAT